MHSGDLNIRIVVKSSTAVDDLGQPTNETTIATLWAKRQPLRGREIAAAGTIGGEQTETFTIRYRPDIQPKMIVEYGGTRYAIGYVAEVLRQDYLDLVCTRFN